VVTLAGELVQVELFAHAGLLADVQWTVVLTALSLMPVAA
jgi:hypothetical protein